MIFYVIRHGETDFNRARKMQGYQEVPLNDLGITQAAHAADRLATEGIDRIVCSDLRRTAMTGAIVAAKAGVPMDYDATLRERDPGELVNKKYDDFPAFFTDEAYMPPGGESMSVFRERVHGAFSALAERYSETSEKLAVVTHGMVCRAFVEVFFGREHAAEVGTVNASITIAGYNDGVWSLERASCSAHLATFSDASWVGERATGA